MKIIADCGATRSEWRVLHSDGSIGRITAGGLNASAMSVKSLTATLSDAAQRISTGEQSSAEIHLYMAGLPSEQLKKDMRDTFCRHFPVDIFEIQTDLLGAARAVCGHAPGIAAILGTGSNSCQYDGERIIRQVYSGGFILGDEGSAATLGKLFISDFLKGLVPHEIASGFSARFQSDYSSIVANVYHCEGSPSGYLGSLAPFIMENYGNPYIKELVDTNFRRFIRRSIKQYDIHLYPVGIAGGFGYALKDIFTAIAREEGITVSRFMKSPIDGLVEYHK